MRDFVERVFPLRTAGRLYSLLIQLDDRIGYDSQRLRYLECVSLIAVNAGLDVHIEFRHKTWHDFDVLRALQAAKIGVYNTEIPGFDHVFPLKSYATTERGYIRYSGLNRKSWYPKSH